MNCIGNTISVKYKIIIFIMTIFECWCISFLKIVANILSDIGISIIQTGLAKTEFT